VTHLIDGEFVGDLTKLAAPLATAIAEATITKVFNEALVPLVVKSTAQAIEASAHAEQAAQDAESALEAAKNVRKAVAAELLEVVEEITEKIDDLLPLGHVVMNTPRRS
jgi:hypothetical protein